MIFLKDIVISNEDVNLIGNLLDGTDFNGVDCEKNVSLFVYGFVYDSRTNEIIVTYPNFVWNEKETPIHFSVYTLSKEQIEEVFDTNSVEILTEYKITLPKWNDLCDSYKINMIETLNGGLELTRPQMTLSVEDLKTYLKNKE